MDIRELSTLDGKTSHEVSSFPRFSHLQFLNDNSPSTETLRSPVLPLGSLEAPPFASTYTKRKAARGTVDGK